MIRKKRKIINLTIKKIIPNYSKNNDTNKQPKMI